MVREGTATGLWWKRWRESLTRTRDNLVGQAARWFGGARDEEAWQELEDALLGADVGVDMTARLVRAARQARGRDPRQALREEILALLTAVEGRLELPGPLDVIMVVGVNGTGKTTTIGKLAHRLRTEGKRVVVAAADTFRAAGIDQLAIWANRAGADLVRHREGSDPAAVAFDAVQAARARGCEAVIVDTAGRLHTRVNLMEELKKIHRVIGRELPGAPGEVLLCLDAHTGQNALQQARVFLEAVGVTGIVLTKLDGTARAGVVVAIADQFRIPIKLAGLGEGIEDLADFSARDFVDALLPTPD
ncbi:MAG: signal recognition particle-docking protein FtsY [Bacillota bacterium]|nr:signal recognition particle-docking protein FtsY [Bacillota bacterium]